jgi:hypothetical protein
MTTPAQHPSIAAVRRVSNAYCEIQDALDELRHVDHGLYLIALHDMLAAVRVRSQKELARHKAYHPKLHSP